MHPDPGLLSGHFAGIVGPEAEQLCPCMALGAGREPIATGFENGVDLAMSRKKAFRLPWRLEAA